MYGIMAQYEFNFDFATATAAYGHRSMTESKHFMDGGAFIFPHPYIPYMYGGLLIGSGPYGGPPYGPYTEVAIGVKDTYLSVEEYPNSDTDTVEVRLTSNSSISGGDPFEWIVGYMAQNDKVTEWMVLYTGYWVKVTTIAQGAFTQASYKPFDKWEFTGGFRWNRDSKRYLGKLGFDLDPDGQIIWDWNKLNSAKYRWSEPTYKFVVSHTPTDDIMTYLQYSRGYRTGNVDFDGNASPPEFLNAYEFGLKTRWLDNRLQFNTAIYYYDYKNYNRWTAANKCTSDINGDHYCDDIASDPTGPSAGLPDGQIDTWDYDYNVVFVSLSPGGAEQKGVSVNLTYLLTVDDSFSLNATWRKNKYGDYNFQTALLALYPDADNAYRDFVDESGKEFGTTPIRGNISYTHTFRFNNNDTLNASTTLFYNGKGIDQDVDYGEPTHIVMPGRDAYWTGDISLTYMSERWLPKGKRWHIRATVNNFWDEEALESITYTNDTYLAQNVYPPGSGVITGTYILPRSYHISFGIDF